MWPRIKSLVVARWEWSGAKRSRKWSVASIGWLLKCNNAKCKKGVQTVLVVGYNHCCLCSCIFHFIWERVLKTCQRTLRSLWKQQRYATYCCCRCRCGMQCHLHIKIFNQRQKIIFILNIFFTVVGTYRSFNFLIPFFFQFNTFFLFSCNIFAFMLVSELLQCHFFCFSSFFWYQ